MDESKYLELAGATLRVISDGLDAIDPDDAELTEAGDVLTLVLRGSKRCVINTQRATRQIWMAANARAWHFAYDPTTQRWLDDKGRGEELLATLSAVIREGAGVEVRFASAADA